MPSVAERHIPPTPAPHRHTARCRKRKPICVEGWTPTQRREYNLQNPLLRLCPDVLEHIFLLGAQGEEGNARVMRWTVLNYAQTCSQWRLVALGVKPLWAALVQFDKHTILWNNRMLRRSHPIPLTQQVSFTPQPTQHRLPETAPVRRKLGVHLDYLNRMQHFAVSCPDVLWDFLVARMCSSPAPHLQTLAITYHPSNPSAPGHSLPTCLPSTLFAGDAPELKKLSLTECMVNFTAPIFRQLNALHVVDLSLADAPTAKEWLRYLAMMPDLEFLKLEGAIASEWDRPTSASSSMQSMSSHHALDNSEKEGVRFPVILDLMLDADVEDVATLLDALPIPSPCRWSVLCANSRPGPAVNTVLAAYNRGMAQCYPFSDSPISQQRTPTGSPDLGADAGSMEVCPLALAANSHDVYVVSQRPNPTDRSQSVILYADFHCTRGGAGEVTRLFTEVAAGLSGTATEFSTLSSSSKPATGTSTILRATSLEVNVPQVILALPSFRDLMRAARRVHTLVRLSATMTRTLLPAIGPDPTDEQREHQPQSRQNESGLLLPLPSLAHIVFVDDDSMWRGAYDIFLVFVAARRWVGAPLKDVYFSDCCVLEDRVRELKEAGIEVEGGVGAKRWWNL